MLLNGMPIIARINNNMYGVFNNELFTIKSIDRINSTITITDESDKIINIKTEIFQQLFYIAFCITVHKSQGSTLNHNYTVHEFGKFDDKLKYVALSRSSCIENIIII